MTRPVDAEARAARFIAQEMHEATHDRLVWAVRHNRDTAVAGVPEWEKLRALASHIKEHTLTHLDHYLEQFEANATKLGTHIHWARDAEEHNAVVYDILNAHKVRALIKSKSMLQEECGMTPYLQRRGIEVTESDLGERIQQLSHEPPSHIVAEAGAVWLTQAELVLNTLGVLSQHLVILLDTAAVVETMHDASGRIDLTASPSGLFMAGPSATGDIEGVIIHGAQGARSLTVLLLACQALGGGVG
jgi:L-lactate utilization protein LutC